MFDSNSILSNNENKENRAKKYIFEVNDNVNELNVSYLHFREGTNMMDLYQVCMSA